MLFSCLTDADRLDTERFMDVESWKKRVCRHRIADLLPKLDAYMQMLQANVVDTEVNRIRKWCRNDAEKLLQAGRDSIALPFLQEAARHCPHSYGL